MVTQVARELFLMFIIPGTMLAGVLLAVYLDARLASGPGLAVSTESATEAAIEVATPLRVAIKVSSTSSGSRS